MSDTPLVSCVMPTRDRPKFVYQAIRYFERQSYPNRELVVLDNGTRPVDHLIPANQMVRYIRVKPGAFTLGAIRNQCVECSVGDLILHWDDDDWHGPNRIAQQVQAMLAAAAPACGFDPVRFFDIRTGKSFEYKYGGGRPYLYGGSLLYTREFWRAFPFPDQQKASTTVFTFGHDLARAVVMDSADYVGIAHEGNTSPKCFCNPWYTPWAGSMNDKLGADWPFYGGLHG